MHKHFCGNKLHTKMMVLHTLQNQLRPDIVTYFSGNLPAVCSQQSQPFLPRFEKGRALWILCGTQVDLDLMCCMVSVGSGFDLECVVGLRWNTQLSCKISRGNGLLLPEMRSHQGVLCYPPGNK